MRTVAEGGAEDEGGGNGDWWCVVESEEELSFGVGKAKLRCRGRSREKCR